MVAISKNIRVFCFKNYIELVVFAISLIFDLISLDSQVRRNKRIYVCYMKGITTDKRIMMA